MKKQLLLILILFCGLALNAQTIYLSTLGNKLVRLDINSCQYEEVVDIQTLPNFFADDVTDITFHPDNSLYGINFIGELFSIDTITGTINLIHQFSITQSYNSLTAADDGLIYATGANGDLLTYNLTTGIETHLGQLPFGAAGDLAFYNGDLYVALQESRILKVNFENIPNSEVIIEDSRSLQIYGIVTYIDECRIIKTYAVATGSSRIYEIDFENNTLNLVCELDVNMGGGASSFEYLGASAAINIEDIEIKTPDCLDNNGTISISATADTGIISFSLDGINFQSSGVFSNLDTGSYTLIINNDIGCPILKDFTLENVISTVITSVRTGDTECSEPTGYIAVSAKGGAGKLQYSIDETNYQDNNTFLDVDHGTYTISIIDEADCILDTVVNILQNDCHIFIPNAFTPNNDSYNDLFKIYPHSAFLGQFITFKIFNRWGEMVFEANNFDVSSTGWDGTSSGISIHPSGVYAYFVEVQMENGERKILKGDVTLLR